MFFNVVGGGLEATFGRCWAYLWENVERSMGWLQTKCPRGAVVELWSATGIQWYGEWAWASTGETASPRVFTEDIGGQRWAAVRFDGVLARGAVDVVQTVEALRAYDFAGCVGLLLHIASRGGSVRGLAELGAFCRGLGKPVVACVQEAALSGGYWLAVAAQAIICAASTDEVGGAGVMVHFEDDTGYLASRGLVSKDVYSTLSPRKNRWWRLLQRGEEEAVQREYLDPCCQEFLLAIHRGRGSKVAADDTLYQGDQLLAREALARGWIDGIGDYRQLLSEGLVPLGVATQEQQQGEERTMEAKEEQTGHAAGTSEAAVAGDTVAAAGVAGAADRAALANSGNEPAAPAAAAARPTPGAGPDSRGLEALTAQVVELKLQLGKLEAVCGALREENERLKALPGEASVQAHASPEATEAEQGLLAFCQAHADDPVACVQAIRASRLADTREA